MDGALVGAGSQLVDYALVAKRQVVKTMQPMSIKRCADRFVRKIKPYGLYALGLKGCQNY